MKTRVSAAYGLRCDVNFQWSWCTSEQTDNRADLRVVLGELGPFAQYPETGYSRYATRASRTRNRTPAVVVERGADGHFRITYAAGARFIIAPRSWEVFGVSLGQLTHDDLLVYLQGPILGFTLRLRGVTCLHASAVVIDGRAVAVVGSGGMGKSTSAAALARLGLTVLTDDVLAVRDLGDCFHVEPGLPRVLLWPPSAEALFGHAEALPRIVGTWDKRYLDLTGPGFRFAKEAAPLGAIYVLVDRLDAEQPTQITPLHGANALMQLVANTYANDFLDAAMRAAELKVLARMLAQVPVRQVRAPNDRKALLEICSTIVADAQAIWTKEAESSPCTA